MLATAGVAVSIVVVAVVTRWLLNLMWRDALLLGAVLAPTDAAAVFSVLRKLPFPPWLSGVLEGESGLNDLPAVLAVTLLSDLSPHAPSPALIAAVIAYQLAAGAAIGLVAGLLGALALRRVALPTSGLYPIAVLALIVASYGAASLAHASGFLAVYVSSLVLGNIRLPHGPATRGFAEGVAWLAQIGLFVMLGCSPPQPGCPRNCCRPLPPGLCSCSSPGPPQWSFPPCRCECPGATRLACPGLGWAARRRADRAGDDSLQRPRAGRHPPVRRSVHHRRA
jgi:NhaP-type Na+/H+ and K+/H+ antiporter